MSAGLPGLGLGGIFFILTALVAAPATELVRTARGRSSLEAWRGVGRQFAMAVVMVIAVDLTVRGLLLALSLAGGGEGASDGGLTVLPLVLVGITAALMAVLLGGVKLLELCLRLRDRGLPRISVPVPTALGQRIVPGAGVLAVAWVATGVRTWRDRVTTRSQDEPASRAKRNTGRKPR